MGLKMKCTTKHDDFPDMFKRLKAVDGIGVEVGVLKGEHAWLASIHEYGCDIPVTPKMRAFLHGQGFHLKESTTSIRIPERSFLRTGYDANREAVMQKGQLLLRQVAAGNMTANGCMKALGLELSSKIKDYAVELSSPGNHPFTVDQKGSSNPLVDSGDMIGSITWRKAK